MTSSAARPRVRMTGVQRRRQLLDIGRELFAQKGFEATSIEEVAARADVSKPVVYEHFGGKEGLYAVVVDREMHSLLDRITASLSAEHPRALLEQAIADGQSSKLPIGRVLAEAEQPIDIHWCP